MHMATFHFWCYFVLEMEARRGFMMRVCVLVALGTAVSAQTTDASKTIILSGAGTTNPQNYFRTVMEYLTVESKLPVITPHRLFPLC